MNSKVLGGILLIVGTSIGGGMLALPLATAEGGFIGALVLLIGFMVGTYSSIFIATPLVVAFHRRRHK